MDSYRFKAANYLANFDWISSSQDITQQHNRSLIENLICHDIANKSTTKAVNACLISGFIFVYVLCAILHQRDDDNENDDENVPTKFFE